MRGIFGALYAFGEAVWEKKEYLVGGSVVMAAINWLYNSIATTLGVAPLSAKWVIVGIVILACFLAWYAEHKRANELADKLTDRLPQISAVIEQLGWGKDLMFSMDGGKTFLPQALYLWAVVKITNTGAATALSDYSLIVRLPSGHEIKGQMLMPPATLRMSGIPFPFGEPLDERTMRPVERGIPARGRVIALIPGVADIRDISGPGFVYEVTFRDPWFPTTPLHSACLDWMPVDKGGVMTFPGLGASHAPVMPPDPPQPPQKKRKKK